MNSRITSDEMKTLGNHPFEGLPEHIPGNQLEQPIETRRNHAIINEEESEFEADNRYYQQPQNTDFYHAVDKPAVNTMFGEFDKQTLIMFFVVFFVGFLIGNLRRPVILKA
jgi:hypothetical protein